MNPLAVWKTLGLAGRVASVLIVVIFLTLVWWVVIGRPAHDRQAAAAARSSAIVSQGQANAAHDAVGVITANSARETDTDHQTKEAEDAIRSAPDDQRNSVALARLCMSDAARGDPACVSLRKLGPK